MYVREQVDIYKSLWERISGVQDTSILGQAAYLNVFLSSDLLGSTFFAIAQSPVHKPPIQSCICPSRELGVAAPLEIIDGGKMVEPFTHHGLRRFSRRFLEV